MMNYQSLPIKDSACLVIHISLKIVKVHFTWYEYSIFVKKYFEMKKSTLYILIAISGAALAGLIGVQAYWINNAYTIKEQQFSQLINTTVNHITEDVQSYEIALVIHEMDAPYPFQRHLKPQGTPKHLLDTIIASKKPLEMPYLKVSNEDKNAFWNNTIRNHWQPQSIVQQSFTQINTQFNGNSSSMQISSSSSMSVIPAAAMSAEEWRTRRRMINDAKVARLQQSNFNLEDRIDVESLD